MIWNGDLYNSNSAPTADAGSDQSIEATGLTTSITLDGSASSDPDGDALSYSCSINGSEVATGVSPTLSLERSIYTITLTIDDGNGETSSDDVVVEIYNTVPTANAGVDQTLEATGVNTSFVLDGSQSSDNNGDELTYNWSLNGTTLATTVSPSFDLGLGTHVFTLSVDDGYGGVHSDEVVVEIKDTTAPALSFNTEATNLWPPNHKMVLVLSGVSSSDIVDSSPSLNISVDSNESANGKGDGNTAVDYEIVEVFDGSFDVYVRSERSGKGSGRIYTISVSSTDASGNNNSHQMEVSVSKSNGRTK